jgi:hypothetical protein
MTTLEQLSRPGFAMEFDDFNVADLPRASTFVFAAQSTEERGRHPVWTEALVQYADQCFEVTTGSGSGPSVYEWEVVSRGSLTRSSLRDDAAILDALRRPTSVVLDVSGLNHQVWASLVRAFVRTSPMPDLMVVYVEPDRYRSHATPATLGSFDLSVGFEGIRPIPGFTRLARRITSHRRVYVPLLGFEGSRPRLVHTELDAGLVAPIIGLPGFRMEFPAVAIACNQPYRDEVRGYDNLRFARGACPFDAFTTIAAIATDLGADHLQIAPLGTKPHAIGAVLHAIRWDTISEIVYDHPIRRPQRTEGIGTTHVYDVSAFVRQW